jgi:plastocyanin
MRSAGVALLLSGLLVAGCGDSDPSPPTAEDLAEIDLSPDHTITVDGDGFDPASIDLVAGEVVLLVNEGDEAHSFTEEERVLDTGRLLPGEDTTLVLTEPGTYRFHDVEQPDHELTVVVAEGQ